jgi:hypothetical protein
VSESEIYSLIGCVRFYPINLNIKAESVGEFIIGHNQVHAHIKYNRWPRRLLSRYSSLTD